MFPASNMLPSFDSTGKGQFRLDTNDRMRPALDRRVSWFQPGGGALASAGNFRHSPASDLSMHCLILIFVAFVLGCNNFTDATQPAARRAPTTTATTATRPLLKPIELHYGISLARLDLHITVSREGVLRSVRTDNKSYGSNDVDPKNERVEIRQGRLTGEQMADLARLFAEWDLLSSKPYGSVADGGDVSIRYGEKTVSGGSEVPKQVTDARIRLMEFGQSMPVVKP